MPASTKISLRGLRTFCVAAQYESFRAAGEALFITSSAVSHQIKSLETELGQQLFERAHRDLSLTQTGRSLYEDVRPLIEQLNGITASYKESEQRSVVRISVQPFFASEYFVPRLQQFTAAHPEIDIQVGTSDERSEYHPTSSDLSIRLFKAPPENLASNFLFPLRMVAAGSPDFKRNMDVKRKEITSEFPLIVHESRPKAWAEWSSSAGIQLPADSKVTVLDSMIAIVRATERGIGAALVPVPISDQWFKQGSIVRLFPAEYVADVSYFLVGKDDPSPISSVTILRDWILQNFAIPT